MPTLQELKKQNVLSSQKPKMSISEERSLRRVQGADPITEPIETVEKMNKRGWLGNVKYFLGEQIKAAGRTVRALPGTITEPVLQVGLQNFKDISKRQLEEDGVVFDDQGRVVDIQMGEEDRYKRQRIMRNINIYTNAEKSLSRSQRIAEKFISSAQEGVTAPSEEFKQAAALPFKGLPFSKDFEINKNFQLTKMIALGTESFPTLGLAALITTVTKSPMLGAASLSLPEASAEFNRSIEQGLSVSDANKLLLLNTTALTALESIPLTQFMKGGALPARMFKVGLTEGLEEVAQNVWIDSVAKIGYDKTRDVTEGLVEAFVGGTLSGSMVGMFSPNAEKYEQSYKEAQEAGVDVDTMAETVGEQVIANAQDIHDKVAEQVSVPDDALAEQMPDVEEQRGSEELYKQNFEEQKKETLLKKAAASTVEIIQTATEGIDTVFGIVSTRAKHISERLRDKFRQFDYKVGIELKELEKSTEGFHSKFSGKNMDKYDYSEFDLALKNRDMKTIQRILDKYDMQTEYQNVRKMLDEFPEKLKNVGIEMGFIEDYFPRSIKNVGDFMRDIRQDPNWNIIEEAIQKEEKNLGYKFDDAEKARFVSQLLSGYGSTQIRIGKTRFAQKRKIDLIDARMNKHYKDSNVALAEYVRNMNAMIEGRKFLGRESAEVVKLRNNLKNTKKRIAEVTDAESGIIKKKRLGQLFNILDGFRKDLMIGKKSSSDDVLSSIESLTDYIDFIKKIKSDTVKKMVLKELDKRMKKLEDDLLKESTNIENGIGDFVAGMVRDKIIDQKDAEKTVSLIRAKLMPKGITNPAVSFVRDVSYIATLNDIINGITQLSDIFLSIYKNNLSNTLVGLGSTISGKAAVTRDDIGVGDKIAEELAGLRNRDKARDFILKYSGIQPIDAIGKTTFINAAWLKLQKQAKKNNQRLRSEVDRVFGEMSDQVWQDIKDGNLTLDTKYLLFAALSDIQPISMSEVPEGYLTAGNWRIMYMLKTFTLKAIDIARNDAYDQIRQGNVKEGAKNLFNILVTFALMGATTGALKDFILGREPELEEDAMDGVLQLVMFNRYIGYQSKQDGLAQAWMKSQLPPLGKLADDIGYDVGSMINPDQVPKFKSLRDAPLLGEPFYWWFLADDKAKGKKTRSRR